MMSNISVIVGVGRGDAAVKWQLGIQDPATPIAEGIIRLNNEVTALMVGVVVFVSTMLYLIVTEGVKNKQPSRQAHGWLIEVVWTIVPAAMLMTISIPSFGLLYILDEGLTLSPTKTIKVVGHQWYWSYEEGSRSNYDSYMKEESKLEMGTYRQLEVDKRLYIPIETHVRILVTASDVLHSWAVPSLGVKMDACPGRLNQLHVYITRPGVYYGQCSELCGVNHASMPIVVEARPALTYARAKGLTSVGQWERV